MASQPAAPGNHAAADALLRIRRERVHTTMLIELLALLIFLAMTFAFVSRDEMAADPLQDRVAELTATVERQQRELIQLRNSNRELAKTNAELAVTIRRLLSSHTGTLAANDLLTLTKARFDDLVNDAANKKTILDEKQRENARLLARLKGNGGTDLPNCTVAARFLVRIEALSGGGFSVSPMWPPEARGAAAEVTGLDALAGSAPLTPATFRALSAQVRDWGQRQQIPCGFRARMVSRHGNLNQFLAQQRIARQYFYLAL